jgi:hypothetical protein
MRLLLSALLVLVAPPAFAQTVELQPKELSDADVAIRVVAVGDEAAGSRISVEVANRTDGAKTAQVECSAFGGYNAPVGNETAYVERVPARGAIVHDIPTRHTDIKRVLCRVVDVQPAR